MVAAMFVALVGCGGPASIADPVEVKGTVKLPDGRPVKGVILTLQPLDGGHMAGLKVGPDGTFSGKVIPGRYSFFFTMIPPRSDEDDVESLRAALQVIPQAYREAHMDHTVKVPSGGGDLMIELK